VEHEAEILPRLYKAVERLSNYYAQQIEELAAASADKAEALQADLARKVAEEVENHRLRVYVELSSYAVVYLPTAAAELSISDGRREARLKVRLNRYTGHLERPGCHACSAPVSGAVLCRNGHVACDGCLRQCAVCNDVLCAACGTQPCSTCGRQLCEQCGQSCWACGERACAEHLGRCPSCGDTVCDVCRTPCAACGSLQCRSHLRADAVVHAEDGGSPRLVCTACAVRCPGCKQYSARMETCSLSGQRFCENCVDICSQCGKVVGPGFFVRNAKGVVWCRDCARTCESCGKPTSESAACRTCGKGTCAQCANECHACKAIVCTDHARAGARCGHILCDHHAGVCSIGGEVVCKVCHQPCAICGRSACGHHLTICACCGREYCIDCVNVGLEVCRTCVDATVGPVVELMAEPVRTHKKVLPLARYGPWQKATNARFTIYACSGFFRNIFLVGYQNKHLEWVVSERRFDFNAVERLAKRRPS
jgi:hypothetical protein